MYGLNKSECVDEEDNNDEETTVCEVTKNICKTV
jgi:hypothetical protein